MPWTKTITPLYGDPALTKKVVEEVLKPSSEEELQTLLKTELPLLHFTLSSMAPCTLSFYLVSISRQDAFKFFFELITRFLVPGKKLTAIMLFASDFRFEGLSDDLFTAAELAVAIDDPADLEVIQQQKPVIESQIRLGITSAYHALRILEMKELLNDDKTMLIHDRIAALARRKRFDIRLLAEMQQFLVTTTEAFRGKRTIHHLNRLICLLYLFKRNMEDFVKEERHCLIKIMRGQIRSEEKSTPVIGILVAVNLISEQEVFEEPNLFKAVESVIPTLKVKRGSFFSSYTGQSDLKFLYAEFYKPGEEAFTHDEVKKLRKMLPESVIGQVEELLHPIFMPHNEEEIIRNIVTLAKQLRFVKDIPQVIITFHDHTGSDLSFTIILLRLLHKNDQPIEKLFAGSSAEFVKERVKVVGFLRKTYPKEASVFQLRIKKKPFMRQDRSIDLYKARQVVLEALVSALGPVRDYNGGMLSKHREVFAALQGILFPLSPEDEFLLENFFYGITPVIMKNLLEPKILALWFSFYSGVLLDEVSDKLYEKEEDGALFLAITSRKKERIRALYESLVEANLHSTHFAAVMLKQGGLHSLALFYKPIHVEEKIQWREGVVHLLGNC